MNDIREKVEELLYTRDKMMRSYWKTLREGFEGGYPMNWDEPFIALILRERQEATDRAVRVLREAVEAEKKEQMENSKELWECEETECVCDGERRTRCQEARVDTSCDEELLDDVLSAITASEERAREWLRE